MGSYAEAERYVRDCLVAQKHIGASDTQDGIICSKELALLRLERGDPAEAVKVLEELLPRATKFLSADHLMTLLIRRLLARALAEDGQLGKAETICRETLDLSLHAKAREPYGTARTQLTLGRVLVQEGQLEEAEIRLNEALTFFRDDVVSQKRPELSAQAANWLGAIRLLHHDYSNAETLMLSGADQFTAHAVEMSPNERRLALDNMINLYQAWGKPQQQAIWQRKLDTLILTFENR
jgi:tetratricopeptide (TPR) repeat protein